MVLWAYEKVRWVLQMARLVYGKDLQAYGKGPRACEMVHSAYEKGLLGPHGIVLRRAVLSVPQWLPLSPALLRTSHRSWLLHREALPRSLHRSWPLLRAALCRSSH